MQRAMPWDDVRLFLALCRAKTVNQAGKALGVDASTVSRRLAALEETLSTTLFDRGRDGIAPTEAAEGLMPVAEEIEAGILRFANAADGLERDIAGVVRIASPPDLAEVALVPYLTQLLALHPSLRIVLSPGEALADLTRREADLALRTVRPTAGDHVFVRLLGFRWVAVGTPELVRSLGTIRSWADVPWIGWGERLRGIPPSRWLDEHVKGVDARVRSDSLALQIALVRAGSGVALIPEPGIAHYGLVPVDFRPALRSDTDAWPTDEVFLVTHRALRAVPRVQVVWNLLVARFRDGGGFPTSRASSVSGRRKG